MAVQDITLDAMTAEELLAAMARPETSRPDRERIRERLVQMHSWLANSIVRRYRNRGEPVEDLLQVAYLGLMKAINGYDAGLGHEFRGYAAITMAGEVKRHFRDHAWAVKVPHVCQERRSELNRLVFDLAQSLQRSPTIAELAAHMQLTHEQVLLTLEAAAAYSTYSLDARLVSDEDGCLGDLIADQDDCLDVFIDVQAVKPLIDALPSRERNILLLRFYGDLTQAEIADEVGISQMHVSRILRAVLDGLRAELAAEGGPVGG
ncbi:SigB/SigF/SigG family RNA polymerase sigma factor [Nonomuraea dietziae]|uniref:RNA polymerase sigma-B factor n=1 Tax=Nonomuraea dietziae TaxID=65515 RepID=A0A7W5YKT9_9ACTN|nr:SigB/SigF/SigG family RNA polymerase sigma factor [Nonomuraea dietziae]MBB3724462.1 RNA polymerase sigma-B factor [Nonomuraea dietziae]